MPSQREDPGFSERLLAQIKEDEGFRDTWYQDPGGVLTIGHGHSGDWPKDTITRKEADQLAREDIRAAYAAVDRLVQIPDHDLTPHQRDALASLVFNVGETKFRKSKQLKALNRGDITEAISQWSSREKGWVKAWDEEKGKYVELPGLVTRRKGESDLFLRGYPDDPIQEFEYPGFSPLDLMAQTSESRGELPFSDSGDLAPVAASPPIDPAQMARQSGRLPADPRSFVASPFDPAQIQGPMPVDPAQVAPPMPIDPWLQNPMAIDPIPGGMSLLGPPQGGMSLLGPPQGDAQIAARAAARAAAQEIPDPFDQGPQLWQSEQMIPDAFDRYMEMLSPENVERMQSENMRDARSQGMMSAGMNLLAAAGSGDPAAGIAKAGIAFSDPMMKAAAENRQLPLEMAKLGFDAQGARGRQLYTDQLRKHREDMREGERTLQELEILRDKAALDADPPMSDRERRVQERVKYLGETPKEAQGNVYNPMSLLDQRRVAFMRVHGLDFRTITLDEWDFIHDQPNSPFGTSADPQGTWGRTRDHASRRQAGENTYRRIMTEGRQEGVNLGLVDGDTGEPAKNAEQRADALAEKEAVEYFKNFTKFADRDFEVYLEVANGAMKGKITWKDAREMLGKPEYEAAHWLPNLELLSILYPSQDP